MNLYLNCAVYKGSHVGAAAGAPHVVDAVRPRQREAELHQLGGQVVGGLLRDGPRLQREQHALLLHPVLQPTCQDGGGGRRGRAVPGTRLLSGESRFAALSAQLMCACT